MDPEKSNIIKINRFKKMTFSEMKKINKEKIENKEHIGEKVANKKLLVEILNLDIDDLFYSYISIFKIIIICFKILCGTIFILPAAKPAFSGLLAGSCRFAALEPSFNIAPRARV